MVRLTNKKLLVRIVDAVDETIAAKQVIYNFPFSQILYCVEGRGYIINHGGLEYSFSGGDMMFIDEALLCGLRSDGGPLKIKKIACDTSMAPNLMNYFSSGRIHILNGCGGEIIRKYTELFKQSREAASSENKKISLGLYHMMIMLGQEIADRNNNEQCVMEQMAVTYKKYMFQNFKAYDKIGSAQEIEALFKKLYNMSVDEYNVLMRLEKSKSFVVFENSYAEVAKYLGFKDESDFVRRFREQYGIGPHEFRTLYM